MSEEIATNGSDAASSSSPAPAGASRERLHISNLPTNWKNEDAKVHFGKYGRVVDVVIFHYQDGRARYGFIELESKEATKAAMDAEIAAGTISVKLAQPKNTAPVGREELNPARLYVGNIGAGTSNEQLRAEFEKFGKLQDCSIWANKKSGTRSADGEWPQSAFIQFENAGDAKNAKESLHGKMVLRGIEEDLSAKNPNFVATPPLIVDFARPKPVSERKGGEGGRRNGGDGGNNRGRDDRRGGNRYDDRDREYDDRRYRDRYDDRRRDDYDRRPSRYDDRRRYDDRDRDYGRSSYRSGRRSRSRSPPQRSRSRSRSPPPRRRSSRSRSRSRSPRRDRR